MVVWNAVVAESNAKTSKGGLLFDSTHLAPSLRPSARSTIINETYLRWLATVLHPVITSHGHRLYFQSGAGGDEQRLPCSVADDVFINSSPKHTTVVSFLHPSSSSYSSGSQTIS